MVGDIGGDRWNVSTFAIFFTVGKHIEGQYRAFLPLSKGLEKNNQYGDLVSSIRTYFFQVHFPKINFIQNFIVFILATTFCILHSIRIWHCWQCRLL